MKKLHFTSEHIFTNGCRIKPVFLPVILSIIIYLPTLNHGFLNLDDYRYISALHPLTLRNAINIFFRFYEGYHPLTILSLAFDFMLSGFNPWLFHAGNILLHTLNTMLLYYLIRKLFPAPIRLACFTAVVFAIHPVHVEAVAWITARKDLLYSFFYLAGLVSYCHYLDKKRFGYSLITGLAFLCAVLAKGMAVTFPLALLLILFLSKKHRFRHESFLLLPLFAIALFFGIINIAAQQASGYVPVAERMPGVSVRISNALACLWFYLLHLISPLRITAFHPYPAEILMPVICGIICLASIMSVSWIMRRKEPAVSFACLFFLIHILPVLQMIPVADFMVADRYNYLASIGFCLLAGLGAEKLFTAESFVRKTGVLLGGLYLFALIVVTSLYLQAWQSPISLWQHVGKTHPHSPFAATMLAGAYSDSGNYSAALNTAQQALLHRPGYARALLIKGHALHKLGRLQAAFEAYSSVLKITPGEAAAWNNRGLVRRDAGDINGAMLDFAQALQTGTKHPDRHLFYANMAEILLMADRPQHALAAADESLKLRQRNFNAHFQRARALYILGRPADALKSAANAKAIAPQDQRVIDLINRLQ